MSQSQTYEQRTANRSLKKSPDPIHYDPNYSYRNQPYRHLHHQNGTIGYFNVRIVEARNLKRSHWSVLGMGVVKHLGLSNAHGEVSAFASLRLGYRFRKDNSNIFGNVGTNRDNHIMDQSNVDSCQQTSLQDTSYPDWQHSNIASVASVASASVNNTASKDSSTNNAVNPSNVIIYTNNKMYQSSTIPSNSNPKWPSVQTENNTSVFNIPLTKGSMPQDGMDVILSIQMKEKTSAADSFVPIGKGGGSGDGILGVGEINLTGLVLRDLLSQTSTIGTHLGDVQTNSTDGSVNEGDFADVYDQWINLTDNDNNSKGEENKSHGQVRLLISYEPHGLTPQKGDTIAFESFARRPTLVSKSPMIVPPLHPLKVKDIRGEYILAAFDMMISSFNHNDNVGNHMDNSSSTEKVKKTRHLGSFRIHRNAIFVIERTNLFDTAVDLSLKPTDVLLSTKVGQDVSEAAQPYIDTVGDILAPAILSSKLLLEAGKIGGGAVAVGLKSAMVSVIENSNPEKRRNVKRSSIDED